MNTSVPTALLTPVLHRYILPFNGGLRETGAFAPVSVYPSARSEGVDKKTAGEELIERLAALKALQEDSRYNAG